MRLTDRLVAPWQLQKVGGTPDHKPSVSFPVSTSSALQRPRELHLRLLVPPFGPDAAGLVEQGGLLLAPPALLLEDASLVLPPPPLLPASTVTSFRLPISIQSLHALGFLARVVASDYLLHSPHLKRFSN